MSTEKLALINYNGAQISLYSDERDDYINLTDLANAFESRKSILTWLRNGKTIEFLNVWEKKHNPIYHGAQMSAVLKLVQDRSLTIKKWVELTNAKGIFTRMGDVSGTYAHKDIAIKYAGWLSPELELHLIEEIQRLKELERKKNSNELLSHEEILKLVRLKEVFKYVAHQELIEDAHKEVFAAKSGSKSPFVEFNVWRNKILDIEPDVINERIRQYCIDNKIALTNKIIKKPKADKILLLDTYEAVRNAVWDFLQIEGEVNALNLANLVEKMIRTEKGEIIKKNETDLFHEKQDLGEFSDFSKTIGDMKIVKTAREVLAHRKMLSDKHSPQQKKLSSFDQKLLILLGTAPPKKDKPENTEPE